MPETAPKPTTDSRVATSEQCDHCGSETLKWVKCKLICRNCRQIVKSCADL